MTWVAGLTWEAVERELASGSAAILPIGAGAKEHGLHLPMNTDQIQAEWLAERLAGAIGALVWPPLLYGYYPAFDEFPGGVGLTRSTFAALVLETMREILKWKPRRLYILDTGLSTIEPIDEAIAETKGGDGVVHLKIHDGPRYRAAATRIMEQAFGSHADELETSCMLVIAPAKVDMTKAVATPGGPFERPLTRGNAPSGSYGDPTRATTGKGHELLDAMIADLIETCELRLR